MTHPTLDHEERLRRALRAAADSVEPAADGLGRIRARLTPPRPVIAAWMVSGTEPAVLRLRLAVTWLRLRLGLAHGRIGPAVSRTRPALGRITAAFTGVMPARGGPRTRAAWLRPAGAMAAFVVIIGSGALAIGQLQQTATLSGRTAAIGHSGGHPSSGSGGGQADAGGAHQLKNTLKNTTWPLAPLTPQRSTGLLAPDPREARPAVADAIADAEPDTAAVVAVSEPEPDTAAVVAVSEPEPDTAADRLGQPESGSERYADIERCAVRGTGEHGG
jgi:hypothetical protein